MYMVSFSNICNVKYVHCHKIYIASYQYGKLKYRFIYIHIYIYVYVYVYVYIYIYILIKNSALLCNADHISTE